MRDSYERFFSEGCISKEQFFDFGIRETIYAPLNVAKIRWEKLKQHIKSNQPVYIRGFGRNARKSHLYEEFYKHVLGNENVLVDPTNNTEPARAIRDLTGYSKVKSAKHKLIANYQVSHIFGRTKNIFAFTAPWNIVYIPKIIDPFTGHEAKGNLIDEYQLLFRRKSYSYFKPLIEDYNEIISDREFKKGIDSYLESISCNSRYSQTDTNALIKSVRGEITPISVS